MSSPAPKNIPLPFFGKSWLLASIPLPHEGRFGRSSRNVERGCDGRGWRATTRRAIAYGEIVRSRSPDAGITLADDRSQATVARQPGAPRRSRISRNTIAQGTPVVSAALWLLACAKCTFLCTQGSRVRPASGVPCALLSLEGHERCITRAFRAARMRSHTLRCHAPA